MGINKAELETVLQRYSIFAEIFYKKSVLKKITKLKKENTFDGGFFKYVSILEVYNVIKERLQYRSFHVNVEKLNFYSEENCESLLHLCETKPLKTAELVLIN